LEKVSKAYPTSYEESMNTVLKQELIRFNNLIRTVKSTLNDLIKAVKGLVVMNDEIEAIMTSLLDNKIPTKWLKNSYPSLKPMSSYVSDLQERILWLNNWINNDMPICFWISGF
jgi:dynein heavy chain